MDVMKEQHLSKEEVDVSHRHCARLLVFKKSQKVKLRDFPLTKTFHVTFYRERSGCRW